MGYPAVDFLHALRFDDMPVSVVRLAERCLIDTLGVAAAGTGTRLSRIIRDHAVRHFGPGHRSARILFDGRAVSPLGAALAGAATIDSLDAHDGHPLTKGHVGVAVVPALLAYLDAEGPVNGRELLTRVAMGYEIGTRAGIVLHATSPDYHTSGAWNAVACAALGARALALDDERTRHALGIAEYHGPRSQMMRCIDHPTMLKDGSGWGALAGVQAAYLAADGFTGAPALTVEQPEAADTWADLGQRWRILEQYFKPYPVCRWGQPAVEAALSVVRGHDLRADDIDQVVVTTFHEATRLAAHSPLDTEQAQYSLPFPVAASLVYGTVGPEQIGGDGLRDPAILRLSRSMVFRESDDFNRRFPAERWAQVTLHLRDGRRLASEPATARGDAAAPLSDDEISTKFRSLASPVLGRGRARRLEAAVGALVSAGGNMNRFFDDVFDPSEPTGVNATANVAAASH